MNSNSERTERMGFTKTERIEKDPFLEIGIRIPDNFEKLVTIYERKIQAMVEKGWDTGNDPDKLATFERWHSFKSRFSDEQAYQQYLRDKKLPLIQEFIASIDMGGWIKKERFLARIHCIATVLNLEVALSEKLFTEEIKRQGIEIRSMVPAPNPVRELKANIIGQGMDRKVEITWAGNADCSHYIICRGTSDSPPANPRQGRLKMLPSSVNSYTHPISEQDIGLSFCYVIFSFRQDDNQTSSTSVEVHCPGELNPQKIHAYQEYNEIVIEWQPIPNIAHYRVVCDKMERKCEQTIFRYRPRVSQPVHYEITAVFENGTVSQSVAGSCQFQLPPIEAPACLSSVEDDNIVISWNPRPESGWSYRLMRSEDAGFKDAALIWHGTSNKVADPKDIATPELKAQPGILYYYAVYPYHEVFMPLAIQKVPEKLTLSYAGPVLFPKEVINLKAEQKGQQIQLTWQNPSPNCKCHVFKSTQPTIPFVHIAQTIEPAANTIYCGCVVNEETYLDQHPHQGTNCYLVIADYGKYGFAPGMIATTSYYPAPPTPTEFNGESNYQSVRLLWKRPIGPCTGYTLYRAEQNDLAKAIMLAQIPDPERTSYEDRGVQFVTDQPYFYFIFAKNHHASSAMAQCGPFLGFSEIQQLEIIPRGTIVELTWQAPTLAHKVVVYRKSDAEETLLSQDNRNSYIDAAVLPGITYQYRIVAVYLKKDSSFFQTQGAIAEITIAPEQPYLTYFHARHLGSYVILEWEPPSDGSLMILSSPKPLEIPLEMNMDQFKQWKQQQQAITIVPTANNPTEHRTTSSPCFYYPMIVLHNRIYFTRAIRCHAIPELIGNVRGYCVYNTNDLLELRLEWDWPYDLQKVRVCRGTGKYPRGPQDPDAKIYDVLRSGYFSRGWFTDPELPQEPEGQLYCYTLYRIEEIELNVEQYSPGVDENCKIAVFYARTKINIYLMKEKNYFFYWNAHQTLQSICNLIHGDFALAYSIHPALPNSWQIIDNTTANILQKSSGKVALPKLPPNAYVKILWHQREDGRWIECHPWRLKIEE